MPSSRRCKINSHTGCPVLGTPIRIFPCQEGWHRPALSLFAKVSLAFSCTLPKAAHFQKFAFAQRSGAMKAPVGLLSDRTVLRSKMEGPRPDKFAFAQRSGAMKAPVGLLSDRTVLRSKMEGPRPDKFHFYAKESRLCKPCAEKPPIRANVQTVCRKCAAAFLHKKRTPSLTIQRSFIGTPRALISELFSAFTASPKATVSVPSL